MRLKRLETVMALAAMRADLVRQRDCEPLLVTVGGEPDEALTALALPVARREQDARVAEVDRRLEQLGVTVD